MSAGPFVFVPVDGLDVYMVDAAATAYAAAVEAAGGDVSAVAALEAAVRDTADGHWGTATTAPPEE